MNLNVSWKWPNGRMEMKQLWAALGCFLDTLKSELKSLNAPDTHSSSYHNVTMLLPSYSAVMQSAMKLHGLLPQLL